MQKAGADGVPKPDLSTAGRKRRKLALGVVLTSSMLLQKRRGCLAGLGVACRLYIIFTVKMKPAFLKQTLLFPAGLMLRGFDFRLASKIQKIYSPFLTSLLLHLFLNFSFQARFRERVRGWNPCSFLTGMEGKNDLEISSMFPHWPPVFFWPSYQSQVALCIKAKGETK